MVSRALLLVSLVLVACDESAAPASDAGLRRRDAGLPLDAAPACRLHSDCAPGFYCKETRCAFDCRVDRDCAPGARCESGQCLTGPECVTDADCGAPARVCLQSRCADGCGTTGCAAGGVCDPATGRCASDPCAACGPGERCVGGACVDACGGCRADEQCIDGRCVDACGGCPAGEQCIDGACVDACGGCPAGERCVGGECMDACGGCPAGEQCVDGACIDTCGGCPAGDRCVAGRCEPCGGCAVGQRCDRPSGRCVVEDCGGCPPGERCDPVTVLCGPEDCGGCPEGERCDRMSGQCLAGPARPGEDCVHDDDCDTGLCLGVSVAGRPERVCSTFCCTETQCPAGFGCIYLSGIRYCLPGRLNPVGPGFNADAFEPCGENECRSALCNARRDRCVAACCTDADCGGLACNWGLTGDTARTFCDIPLGFGRTGDGCFSEFDCQSGVCIPTGGADVPGQCADLCCTSAECPGGLVCGQVIGPGGALTNACVPQMRGAGEDGAACRDAAECQSGVCASGLCAEPCCFDLDCRGDRRCRPADNGEGGRVRACFLAE